MLRRVGNLFSLAVLSAVATTSPAVARLQRQPSADQPQLSGSARLTGRVVTADDGRPVRRAYVRLSGLPDSQRDAGASRVYVTRTVETDVNGRFDFADLPTGSYSINVDPVSGFVRLERRERRSSQNGERWR